MVELNLNQFALVNCAINPQNNRYEFGPVLIKLKGPFESVGPVSSCIILDQDDFLVVTDSNGNKENIRGPSVYRPRLGDRWDKPRVTIQVPINHFMIVNDSNDTQHPVRHIRGPIKFFPEPFQTVSKNGNLDYYPCIEVTQHKAVHIQRADGSVIMLDTPQYYMPQVGERVVKEVVRNVMLLTDFCILKAPDGTIYVMNGRVPEDRSFFVRPFYEFLKFNCETEKTILSTLPTFMPHKFTFKTSDNVDLNIDLRISFQIQDVETFSLNPIDFYPFIKNNIQNELLNRFAQATLREFMSTFSRIAQKSTENCSASFQLYGIIILDIQVLNYVCINPETQRLLDLDIHTNVNKQNELRARQNDILIQEQSNEVQRRQKDLEVQMAQKDNEVAMQKKQLENSIRLKEMEIEIAEQHKRTELLEVRRGNDLMEAEFNGRAKGHEFREFLEGVDPGLTNAQKIDIWNRRQDLEQAKSLYEKVNKINMYPPNADLKLFQFGTGGEGSMAVGSNASTVEDGLLRGIGAVQGTGFR